MFICLIATFIVLFAISAVSEEHSNYKTYVIHLVRASVDALYDEMLGFALKGVASRTEIATFLMRFAEKNNITK